MVLRNDHGMFIMAKSIVFPSRLTVEVGEAMEYYEVLSWVQMFDLENVIVEGILRLLLMLLLWDRVVCQFFQIIL